VARLKLVSRREVRQPNLLEVCEQPLAGDETAPNLLEESLTPPMHTLGGTDKRLDALADATRSGALSR